MVRRVLRSYGLVTCLVVLGIAAPRRVESQIAAKAATAAPPATRWNPPRTPWGDPDLQAIWPGTAMMGVPQEQPRQLGDRTLITDEEFAQREAQVRRQDQAERDEFVASIVPNAVGGGTGGPGHWIEHGRPQRQSSGGSQRETLW